MLLMNPCCCSNPCIFLEDTFNRADNSDINVGAPTTYTVTGTTSIASNRLAMGASSSAIFTDTGSGTVGQRHFTGRVQGAAGDNIKIFLGDHYLVITPSATSLNGECALYDASNTLLLLRSVPITANSAINFTMIYGPMSGPGPSMGIATNWFAFPCVVSGDTFGFGTGATASAVTVDFFQLSQHDLLKQGATTACTTITPLDCATATGTRVDLPRAEWTTSNLTWSNGGPGDFAGFPRWVIPIGGTGYAKMTGLLPKNDNIAFYNGGVFAYISNTETYAFPSSIDNGIREMWIYADVASVTGMKWTFNPPGVPPGGTWDVEVWVQGSLVHSDTGWGGQQDPQGHLFIYEGRFWCHCGHKSGGTPLIVVTAPWTALNRTLAPQLEITASNGTHRSLLNIPTVRAAHHPGFGFNCPRADWVYNSTNKGDITPWCSGSVPTYQVLINNIGGDPADLTNINGVAFTPGYAAIDIQGTNRLRVTSVSWIRDSYGDPASIDVELSVFVQFNNAWALFKRSYSAVPACNVFNNDSLTLVDHQSDALFDMSAATAEIDA